ncbi:DUF221-domain-containing protein [Auricularia subglabra TFB-10046 SS5]|nr:DUF221-domain-containing protein [Auricularia subglabra TFB-10046 SS5]
MSNGTSLADEAKSSSTPSFVTALVLNLVIFGAEIAIFTIVRRRFKEIYEPRTFIPAENKRIKPLSDSLLEWPIALWNADWRATKHHNGMDAYFFVKFLRMMVRIFLPIWLASWLVLLPVTSVGTQVPGKVGLDRLTFGNVAPDKQTRYAAHLIMVYFFTAWILWNIKKEMGEFITERQIHLVDPEHSASAQARTVLVTGVPHKFLNERALTQLFSYLPGGVQKVWLNRDLKHLPDLYDRRLDATNKLESAETALISTAAKLRRKHEAAVRKGKADWDEKQRDIEAKSGLPLAEQLVPREMRPTHRLPVAGLPISLPLMGQKVDMIDWCRREIAETSHDLENGRSLLRQEIAYAKGTPADGTRTWKDLKYPPLSSAFVLFHQQIAAHMAAQVLTHNLPYRMSDKYTEVAPADVIWGNLGLNPYEARIRQLISYAATGGLIVLWAFPVTFVGILTNVVGLCKTYSWLAWLCKLPNVVVGILSGVLPPVGLAILMMLLPIVLRLLARFEGIPRRTGIELSLMSRYFIFQVVHGFLIITLASGIIKALPELAKNPTSIPALLATNLPGASTFFITYAILQGLGGSAAGFLQIAPLIMHYVKLFVLSSTPRSVYAVHYDLRDVAWGQLFPSITLLVVVCTAYSVISPVINGFAAVSFFLFYMMWKYLFLYQLDQPASGDTGGLFFPKAIQHTFVGVYIQQICLAALFFLARNEKNQASAIPQGALMIILIGLTAIFHMILNSSYGPMLHSLPLTLANQSYGMPQDKDRPPSVEIGRDEDAEDEQAVPMSPDSHKRLRASLSPSEMDTASRSGHSYTPMPDGQQPIREHYDPNEGTHAEGKHNDEPADFDHPAAVEPQRIVWIPSDALGLGDAEVAACRTAGVLAGSDNALMDDKGHVDVRGHPPGAKGNLFNQ